MMIRGENSIDVSRRLMVEDTLHRCIFNESPFFAFKIILVSGKKFNKALRITCASTTSVRKGEKLSRLSIDDRLRYRARFSGTAPGAPREELESQIRIEHFNNRVRRSVARGQCDARKSAIFPRDQLLSLCESGQNGGRRARCLL